MSARTFVPMSWLVSLTSLGCVSACGAGQGDQTSSAGGSSQGGLAVGGGATGSAVATGGAAFSGGSNSGGIGGASSTTSGGLTAASGGSITTAQGGSSAGSSASGGSATIGGAPGGAAGSAPGGKAGGAGSSSGFGGGGLSGGGGSRSAGGSTGGGAGEAVTTIDVAATVVTSTDLNQPTDLEFNPYVAGELWISNHGDSSMVVVANATADGRTQQRRQDSEGAGHFMPKPTAFAFGGRETTILDAQGKKVEGTFATCPEANQDFMGPTLWTSDLRIFAIDKPNRIAPFNGPTTGAEGPGSHIDMLHRTPTCTGIAWEAKGNFYWTYSGTRAMFVRYDFAKDHGIGNADHSDGSEWRYPVAGIKYVSGVPSHLYYRAESKLLYIADTGNGRVVTFDSASATSSVRMIPSENEDGLSEAWDVSGGSLKELVGTAAGLKRPSGLELYQAQVYVTDNQTSMIHKFSLEGAALGAVHVTNVKAGALAGLNFGPDGKLYFVDMVDGRVLRLEAAF